MNYIKFRFVVLFFLFLSSCTSVTSRADKSNHLGLVYFLPTTQIPVTLSFNTSKNSINFVGGQPIYLPDEKHRYFLNSFFSPFHKETVDLKINKKGLLTTFSVKSEAQFADIATGLAKSGLLQSETSQQSADQQVFHAQIDLAELASTPESRKSNVALKALSDKMNFALRKGLVHADFEKDPKNYLKHVLDDGTRLIDIKVERTTPYIEPAYEGKPDCSVGFCYRLPVVYKLIASFPNGVRQEAIVTVPNGSPIYVASLKRGLFADWTNNITIANGMLTGYKYETSKSELLGAATLPFEVVGASIEALTQQGSIFTTKTGRINKEIAYLEALTKLEKAREDRLGAERSQGAISAFSFAFGSNQGAGQFGQQLNNGTTNTSTDVVTVTGTQAPSGQTANGSAGTGN